MAQMLLNFMKINKYKLLLCSVFLVAAFLRLWKLGSIPPSLTQDEASLGYNAYSILKTGKDEYGKFMPVIFKSFGDYKPGFYIYTAVPFIFIFGLNEVSVRLPSAIAGILIVSLIYLIFRQLNDKYTHYPALSAAFLAAVNPWLIYYSRGAWEANLSLCLTLGGIYFFLLSTKKPKYLMISALTFSLTFWAYQGSKLSTFLVLALLTVVYWKECQALLKNNLKALLLSTGIGLVIVLPVLFSFFAGQTGRLSVFSIFSYPRPPEYTQSFLDQGGEKVGGLNYLLFHSETVNFVRGIMGRWYNHFSGKFLFFEGDYQNPMHSAPNSGMLLLVDILLLPLGMLFLFQKKVSLQKTTYFWLFWLVLAPLPAVLSRDQVQSVRALNMAIPLVFLSSIGFSGLLRWINHKKHYIYWGFGFLIFLSVSLIYFLDSYFVHFPVHNAKYWLYGYKQVVAKVTPVQKNYNRIIFQQSYNQPYIFFLFYQKYDPATYQNKAKLTSGGSDVGLVKNLDNIEFSNFSWPPAFGPGEKALIVGDPVAIPPDYSKADYNLMSEIKYPDKFMTAFRILEKNEKN